MKQKVLLLLVCVAFPLESSGNDGKEENDPAAAIQGEWIVVSLGSSGYEVKGTAERPLTVIFDKDRFVSRPGVSFKDSYEVSLGLVGMKTEKLTEIRISERDLEGVFQLDPSKTPPWIDLREKGKKEGSKGIYRLKNGELEICLGRTFASKRPDDFKNHDSTWLFRLKRKD